MKIRTVFQFTLFIIALAAGASISFGQGKCAS
jgi:hypothetical protein